MDTKIEVGTQFTCSGLILWEVTDSCGSGWEITEVVQPPEQLVVDSSWIYKEAVCYVQPV